MTSTEFTYPSVDDMTITARRWQPTGSARGIVQLTHGMGEHVTRYDDFASYLATNGFLVVGQDHRGHGATASTPSDYGHLGPSGWPALLDDIGRLSRLVQDSDPGLPLVLFGHSMGSFALQQYVLDHSVDMTAMALTGTAAIDILEPGVDLDGPVDLSMFNAPFAPARTDFEWLSRDEHQVDLYVADPRCGFGLDRVAGRQMFDGAREAADPERLAGVRRDLPVYIAVGERDPVNAGQAALTPLRARYESAFDDVTVEIYPGARHEILNETNRSEVYDDLLAWLDRIVPS